jgi:hypothetical protein
MQGEISKRAFERWLERQPEESIVGERGSLRTCPLACFLRERGMNVHVGPDWVVDLEAGEEHPLPPWARSFVRALDDPRADGEDVSREEALEALRRT